MVTSRAAAMGRTERPPTRVRPSSRRICSAFVCLVRPDQKILVGVGCSEDGASAPTKVHLPGGKVDSGERGRLCDTAAREFEEEVGVPLADAAAPGWEGSQGWRWDDPKNPTHAVRFYVVRVRDGWTSTGWSKVFRRIEWWSRTELVRDERTRPHIRKALETSMAAGRITAAAGGASASAGIVAGASASAGIVAGASPAGGAGSATPSA